MITSALRSRARSRPGITLTEILIAIMILGIGLASVATLFPLGLLRLRDAARYSRSTYLAQSAAADLSSRSLLLPTSFISVDFLNLGAGFTSWFNLTGTSGSYNPFIQDTPHYLADWAAAPGGPGAYAGSGGLGITGSPSAQTASGAAAGTYPPLNGAGLPFAYDPLWRYQTVSATTGVAGYYPGDTFEARFGSGIHFVRAGDADGGLPSAHGLQRISNFNRPSIMGASLFVPSIFVSAEDVVWQEPTNQNYLIAGNVITGVNNSPGVGTAPSPVLPDLNITPYQQINDFRYSWMFTGVLSNSSNQACFDGNIVIFENRPFDIAAATGTDGVSWYRVDGETVVEAIFGHSGNINAGGYAIGGDRTVLLRWYASVPDPVVKAGDWIADVTYERSQATVLSRWWAGTVADFPLGIPNINNNGEWDNLPAQRCIWYQVQKVLPAVSDPYLGATYRSMVVYVNQTLQSKTLLSAAGTPALVNAALIAPSVVNVVPTTIFTR